MALTAETRAATFTLSDVTTSLRDRFSATPERENNRLSVVRAFSPVGFAPIGSDGLTILRTFALSSRASFAAGTHAARTTVAPILGPPLTYRSVDPLAGLTYRIADGAALYGHYGKTTRAPTLLTFECFDGSACLLGRALNDPPLRQTVSQTLEAGLRSSGDGPWGWTLSVYRSQANFDLVTLASARIGRNIATNVAGTARKGFDLRLRFAEGPWELSAGYTYLAATYQFDGRFTLPLPTTARAGDELRMRSGDRIPGIAPHQGRVSLGYAIRSGWSVGADVLAVSHQPLAGAVGGHLPGYWIANLHTSLQLTETLSLQGVIGNVFNRVYSDYGAFFETGALAAVLPTVHDPRRLAQGQPISGRAGLLLRW